MEVRRELQELVPSFYYGFWELNSGCSSKGLARRWDTSRLAQRGLGQGHSTHREAFGVTLQHMERFNTLQAGGQAQLRLELTKTQG